MIKSQVFEPPFCQNATGKGFRGAVTAWRSMLNALRVAAAFSYMVTGNRNCNSLRLPPIFIPLTTNLWQHKGIYVCSGKKVICTFISSGASKVQVGSTAEDIPPFTVSLELTRYEVNSVQNEFE